MFYEKRVGGTSAGDTPLACVETQPRHDPRSGPFLSETKLILYALTWSGLALLSERPSAAQATLSEDDHEEIIGTSSGRSARRWAVTMISS